MTNRACTKRGARFAWLGPVSWDGSRELVVRGVLPNTLSEVL